jgi:hypothetical protein
VLPQLLPDNPIESAPNRLSIFINQDASIIVKSYHTTILALVLFLGAYDDRVTYVSAPDFIGGADGDGV